MKCFNRFNSIERHHRNGAARLSRSVIGFLLLLPALALAQPGSNATFSDDNCISMGGFPGVDHHVSANWSALGSGVNGRVNALAVSGNDLYAGGNFTTAGGKVSPYVARAVIARPANIISSFSIGQDFLAPFDGSDGSPGATYTIEYKDELPSAPWRKATNLTAPNVDQGMGVGVFEFRDSTASAPQRFYRAVYPSY